MSSVSTEPIRVSLPDGSIRELPAGSTGADLALTIGRRLAKDALAIDVDGRVTDLTLPLPDGAHIRILTFDSPEGREVYWHSSTHLMAWAVKELFPETLITVGPAIEHGFFYDFDRAIPFTPEDLARIEEKMRELAKADHPVRREVMSRADAIKLVQSRGETYKVDLIGDIPQSEDISFYHEGNFVDLCAGPHLPSTGKIGAIKLTAVSGAYWRADQSNAQLQRIYGITFPEQKQLDAYLRQIEEAKKRDHRKLGVELELYSIEDLTGSGLVLWHPRGARVRSIIEQYWRDEHILAGYEPVYSPHMGKRDLWETSGHLENYADNMFSAITGGQGDAHEEQQYFLKPMNCPFHIAIYQSRKHSYRELPMRLSELGAVYRFERSGVLHGLLRVRGFTQDDAHIFCTREQLKSEVRGVIALNDRMLRAFGFKEWTWYLSTRPADKAIGSEEEWAMASEELRQVLVQDGIPFAIDEGGGAFYGPKIDLKLKDAIGREWQLSTLQFDFNLPKRFGMEYIGEDGNAHQPVMLHRALLGSIERFFGVLVEHYAGFFPPWLAPVQAVVLPISEKHSEYAHRVHDELLAKGFRVDLDERNEKVNYRIREAERFKVPYMLVAGDQEVEAGTLAVRRHREGQLGTMTRDAFAALLAEDVATRKAYGLEA